MDKLVFIQIFNVLNQLPVIQTIIGLKESFQDESRKDSKEILITINYQGGVKFFLVHLLFKTVYVYFQSGLEPMKSWSEELDWGSSGGCRDSYVI